MCRFEYVKYDANAKKDQEEFKLNVESLETKIDTIGYRLGRVEHRKGPARAKALALTALEECYMWIGKAIRDDQIARNGSATLQEEREDC